MKFRDELEAASKQVKALSPKFSLGDLVKDRDGHVGVVSSVGANTPEYVEDVFQENMYVVSFPGHATVPGDYWVEQFLSDADLEAVGGATR